MNNNKDLFDYLAYWPDYLFDIITGKFGHRDEEPEFKEEMLERDIVKTNDCADAHSVWYGQDITIEDFNNLSKHTIVSGATGAGKNVLVNRMIYRKIEDGEAVLYLAGKDDMKEHENFRLMNRIFKRKTYVVSPLSPNSICFNPFAEGDASSITERIMGSFDWSNEFYESQCRKALLLSIKYLREVNLIVTLDRILKRLVEKHNSKDVQSLISKLSLISLSPFGELLSSDDALTFSKLRKEKASIYIGLPSLAYPQMSKTLGKFIYYGLMFHSYEASNPLRLDIDKIDRLYCVLDEFSSIGTPDFIGLMNKCRSSKIDLTILVQCLADLEAIGGTSYRKQILQNTNNMFFGGGGDPDEAEYWAETIGTVISKSRTSQIEENMETGLGSEREVRKLVVHPDIIKKLQVGYFIGLSKTHDEWRHPVVDVFYVYMMNLKARFKKEVLEVHNEEKLKEEKQRNEEISVTLSQVLQVLDSSQDSPKEEGKSKFTI